GNATFKHYANVMKIKDGALNFFKQPAFIETRKKQEKEWREKIAANPEAAKLAGDAFEQIESSCALLGKSAAMRHFTAMPNGRFWGLIRSLVHVSDAMRDKGPQTVQRIAGSFGE